MRHNRRNSQTWKNTCPGFTLIEIVVVISLISIMLFFSLPRFKHPFQPDDTKSVSRWIMLKVKYLKEISANEKKLNILHINLDSNKMWTTDESMMAEELQNAEEKAYRLPEGIRLLDVEFPGGNNISAGTAKINFYKRGYSDSAIIHLENSDTKHFSYIIEPFMPRVSRYDKYIDFGS